MRPPTRQPINSATKPPATIYEIIMVSLKLGEWRCLCPDIPVLTMIKSGDYGQVLDVAKTTIKEFAKARRSLGLRLPAPTEINPNIIQIYTRGSLDYKIEPCEVS